jgi:hypothetical protein
VAGAASSTVAAETSITSDQHPSLTSYSMLVVHEATVSTQTAAAKAFVTADPHVASSVSNRETLQVSSAAVANAEVTSSQSVAVNAASVVVAHGIALFSTHESGSCHLTAIPEILASLRAVVAAKSAASVVPKAHILTLQSFAGSVFSTADVFGRKYGPLYAFPVRWEVCGDGVTVVVLGDGVTFETGSL